MEIVLKEQINTELKLCVAKFSKDYMEKVAMVEIVKCLVNTDTGEIIKKEFYQNRIFHNRIVPQTISENGQVQNTEIKDFDTLLINIKEMGEEAYFEKLLGVIIQEQTVTK